MLDGPNAIVGHVEHLNLREADEVFQPFNLVVIELKLRQIHEVPDARHAPEKVASKSESAQRSAVVEAGDDRYFVARRSDMEDVLGSGVKRDDIPRGDDAVAGLVVTGSIRRLVRGSHFQNNSMIKFGKVGNSYVISPTFKQLHFLAVDERQNHFHLTRWRQSR